MKPIFLVVTCFFMLSCTQTPKKFSSVQIGMDSVDVLEVAGQPSTKRDLEIAKLWIYESADRTLVFRGDTVYRIITSANARMDSIENKLDKLGDKIENKAEKAGEKLDSLGRTF